MQPTQKQLAGIKAFLFVVCLVPFGHLAWGIYADTLGANPIEAVIRGLGDWALRFLLITLSVTPLRKLTGWNWLLRFRRMLGLFAFFYALVHFNVYLGLDQSYDWIAIAKDILKRPFITVGMLAFSLMIPLALTSNAAAIRAIGGKAWQSLHRLTYVLTICAVLHYWWLVKLDITQPAIYATLLAALLIMRLGWRRMAQRAQ